MICRINLWNTVLFDYVTEHWIKAMHSCLVRVYLYVFLGQMRTPDGKECTELPDGAPDQDCRFFDSDDESESYEGSLMYKQFLSQVS